MRDKKGNSVIQDIQITEVSRTDGSLSQFRLFLSPFPFPISAVFFIYLFSHSSKVVPSYVLECSCIELVS